jgi:hypothetical protein
VDWSTVFGTIGNALEDISLGAQALQRAFNSALSVIMQQVGIFWGIVVPVWAQFVTVLQEAYNSLHHSVQCLIVRLVT